MAAGNLYVFATASGKANEMEGQIPGKTLRFKPML
jgi:hypothetical protein